MEIPDFLDVKNTVNGNVISQYDYTHDVLGRRVSAVKSGTMMAAASENLAYGYNARSELVSAVSDVDANYNYAFDDIGNRKTASEAGTQSTYSANNLNQYTSITPSAEGVAEALTYDADGNATVIQTATGTWQISYNAENRPVRFENAGTQTVVECGYDSQGRRFEKKVTVAGTTTLHHRYIYRGYLQIAALDLTRAAHPALWLVTWDPTQPTATRPLAIQKDGTWFTYGYDITKNVCEVFGPAGYIRTAYSYAPFGNVTESGDVSQPFQWSSEHYDSELDLVYYNYRHYSPSLGRFLSRDPIEERGGLNLYAFVGNTPTTHTDSLGLRLKTVVLKGGLGVWAGELSYEEMTDTCKPSISNLTVLKSNVDNPFTYVSLLVIDLVEVSIEQVINKELRPIKKELCFLPPSFVCRGSRQTVSYEVGIKYSIRWFSIPVEIPMLDISIGIPEEATYTKIISVTGRCCRDSI